jgi:quinol monooxygenase YgiN
MRWHNRHMFVITRHRVSAAARETWLLDAKKAITPLAMQQGCLGIELGAATDDAELFAIVSHWASVGDYRRALSAFDVKAQSIPFLSTAVDEPSAFETLHRRVGDEVHDYDALRAFDADTFNLGDALVDE